MTAPVVGECELVEHSLSAIVDGDEARVVVDGLRVMAQGVIDIPEQLHRAWCVGVEPGGLFQVSER